MRNLIAGALLAGLISTAAAADGPAAPASAPDPTQQAMGQMLQEAQYREANALMQAYTLRAQVETLKAQLAAETKRADEAVKAQAENKPQADCPK